MATITVSGRVDSRQCGRSTTNRTRGWPRLRLHRDAPSPTPGGQDRAVFVLLAEQGSHEAELVAPYILLLGRHLGSTWKNKPGTWWRTPGVNTW